jgi:hypothetical protein
MNWIQGRRNSCICLLLIFRVFREVFPTLFLLREYFLPHSLYSLTEYFERRNNYTYN